MIQHSLNCLLCEDDFVEHKKVSGRYEPLRDIKLGPGRACWV